MNKFRVIMWIIPLVLLMFIESIVKIVANLVLVISYPILKKYWKFTDWCEDWKDFKMADWIVETWDLSW